MYVITYKGHYSNYYSYVKKPNIKEIAKYLNDRNRNFKEPVIDVRITDSYDEFDTGIPVFFPSEYMNQQFFETYEERLLEQHRIEQLAV